jgi:hypothetical protein
MMVGDLFYDQKGSITETFFNGLLPRTLASVQGVTMGNHDYWLGGHPTAGNVNDSFGNGHMQWYAQDTMAASDTSPFDFTADPEKNEIVAPRNTFWYYMMGNVAFIGFSNTEAWQEAEAHFKEACQWASTEQPELIVLLGHWNSGGMGCAQGMDTPSAYERVIQLDGCSALRSRIKWVEGHKHCNQILKNNTGFLLGSFGFMEGDQHCMGGFAIPILDTTGGRARLYYYELGKLGVRTNNFDIILDCLTANGHAGCKKYAQLWMDEPLPEQRRSSATTAQINSTSLMVFA